MIQNTFPVPSVSVYNNWTPENSEEKPYFFNRNVFFFRFFPQEITKLKKYYTLFSFAKVDDQPVAFASVIHLMSEKRDWGTSFSKSLLMASNVQDRGSLYDPTTNHKITLAPSNF